MRAVTITQLLYRIWFNLDSIFKYVVVIFFFAKSTTFFHSQSSGSTCQEDSTAILSNVSGGNTNCTVGSKTCICGPGVHPVRVSTLPVVQLAQENLVN